MARNVSTLTKIKKFIQNHDYFYILGHEKPDGDCIGSQLAMSGLLTTLGKAHSVLSAGPFTDNISRAFHSLFINNLDLLPHIPMEKENAALIFLDASNPDRMGQMFNKIYSLPAIIIDHHASTNDNSFGEIRYIKPEVPANTLLIYRLFKEYGIKPNKKEAYYILLGLLTDTQFFRFVKKNDPEPLLVASELVESGVTPGDIYQQISYGYTYLSRKIIAKILDRSLRLNNNRVIMTYVSYKDYTHADDLPQSYEVYQMLEGTHKTEMVIYIQENLNEHNISVCKIGMRSKINNVGAIAQQWGGGGHPNAAGFTLEKTLDETKEILTTYFDTLSL